MHTFIMRMRQLVGRMMGKDTKTSVVAQPGSSGSPSSSRSSPPSSSSSDLSSHFHFLCSTGHPDHFAPKESFPDPFRILAKSGRLPLESLKQFYITVGKEERKCDALCELYGSGMVLITQTVIFCNARWKVEWFTEEMRSRGLTVSALHEGKGKQNTVSLEEFHFGSSPVLITTNLLALEINVKVPLVIICDLPTIRENYIDLIGLLGPKGIAINFVTTENVSLLRNIKGFHNIEIEEMPLHVADLIQVL